MNTEHGIPEFQSLDSPLDLAVQAALAEPLSEEAIERVIARAKPLADVVVTPSRKKTFAERGRPVSRVVVGSLIAAVTLLALAIGSNLLLDRSTAQAFNKFAETLVAAKTARFQMEERIAGQPKEVTQAYYLAPGRYRLEEQSGDVVNIFDSTAAKMVSVNRSEKRVRVVNFKKAPTDKKVENDFERLRELLSKSRDAKDAQYQRLGEKEINGRRAVGFRCDSPATEVTLWGDPATGYPVRIETVWGGLPRTETIMNNFEINIDLKESLFDVTPPAGYKVQSLDVDVPMPSEQSLVDAFRISSEIGGGEFPESLDIIGLSKLMEKEKAAAKARTKQSDEDFQRLMKTAVRFGVGFQFALDLPESADAHYAGNRVKRDTHDRPIFWYKPEGTSKYRVIFADLSVKDADNAPQVPGAKRIEKASKTAKPAAK
jgi:outer membrane lipoprotein-sorting protein